MYASTHRTRSQCIVVALLFALAVLLSGCRQHHYSRFEAVAYLAKEHPDTKIVVSREYASTAHGRSWSAYFADMPDVPFLVYSYWSYFAESVSCALGTNMDSVFLDYYWQQYTENGGNMSCWERSRDDETGDVFKMEATYSCLDDLQKLKEQANEFTTFVSQQRYPCKTYYQAVLDGAGGDAPFSTMLMGNSGDELLEGPDHLLKYYAFFLLDSPDFTPEELTRYNDLFGDERSISVHKKDGPLLDWSGLAVRWTDISYGTLYEQLSREGFEPQGDRTHFSVIGFDGVKYEFSYSFHFDTKYGKARYYYFEDGEKIEFGDTGTIRIDIPPLANMIGLCTEDHCEHWYEMVDIESEPSAQEHPGMIYGDRITIDGDKIIVETDGKTTVIEREKGPN